MITVEHLSHSYGHDDTYQVRDVTFSIAEGEIFGFLGPNGAGKSTVQKIMTGLLPLQQGRVTVAGMDIDRADRGLFNQVGVSFEQPNLYAKLTGLENLRFHAGLYDVETVEPMVLLRQFGLEGAANQRVAEYSKGMQHRLVLARSLLNRPRIWFLDEPTSGLDPGHAREVKDMIKARRDEGVTIFLTTHDMHVADELCDRVAFLNLGQIVAMDAPRELKLAHGEHVLAVERRVDGHVERDRFDQSRPEDLARLYDLLQAGRVETIHSQEATLESVFIALTGRGLA